MKWLVAYVIFAGLTLADGWPIGAVIIVPFMVLGAVFNLMSGEAQKNLARPYNSTVQAFEADKIRKNGSKPEDVDAFIAKWSRR